MENGVRRYWLTVAA